MTSRAQGRYRRISRRLPVVLGLMLLGLISACGPDLAKANFPRTTIPQASSGQGIDAPITDPAVSTEALRTVDPCALLDSTTVTGQLGQKTSAGIDECTVPVTDAGGKTLQITLRLGESLVGGVKNATATIANLPLLELKPDQNTCSIAAVTSRSPELGVTAEVTYAGGDACGAGRTVIEKVIGRLRANPAQLSHPAGSLITIDACSLVDDDTMATALAQSTTKVALGLHSCGWLPSVSGASAKLLIRRIAPPVASETSPAVDLGNGISGVQQTPNPAVAQCAIEWTHRVINGTQAEVVSFLYSNVGAAVATDNPCGKALDVAKTIVPKLPKA